MNCILSSAAALPLLFARGPVLSGFFEVMQAHPVRRNIAVVCLVLAALLTVFKLLEGVILRASRGRKYGRTLEGTTVEHRSAHAFRPSRHSAAIQPEMRVTRYRRPSLFSRMHSRGHTYRRPKQPRRRHISRRRYGRH